VSLGGAEGDRQLGRAALGVGDPVGMLLVLLFRAQADPLGGLCLPSSLLSEAFFASPFLAPTKLRPFEHVSWQDMASGAEEAETQSGSAAMDASRQLQRAGRWEAAADSWCCICLGEVSNAAHIDGCFHTFCFGCIHRWAATRAACPLCRQPFHRVLHTVRADDDYEQYVVSSSARRQRTAAGQQAPSRSPQRRYHLRPRPTNTQPTEEGSGPAGRDPEARAAATLGPSITAAQAAAGERPASPTDGSVPRYDTMALRTRLMAFMESQ